jgi:nucleoside-diphosphate-sugar epimerase
MVMRRDGRAVRAYCYLSDAVAGFFTVLLKGESGVAYHVGHDGAEVSVRELAELLVGMFPERGLRVLRGEAASGYVGGAVDRSCPGIARARGLGWEPEVGLREGFRRTVESYR